LKPSNSRVAGLLIFLAALGLAPLFVRNDFYLDGFILVFLWASVSGASRRNRDMARSRASAVWPIDGGP